MKLLISVSCLIFAWLFYRIIDPKISPLILEINMNGESKRLSQSWSILIEIWPIVALTGVIFAIIFLIIGVYLGKVTDKEMVKQENIYLRNKLKKAGKLQETAEIRAKERLDDEVKKLNSNRNKLMEFKKTLVTKSAQIEESKEIALIAKEEADRLVEEANETNEKATKKSHNATNALRRYKTKIAKLENKIKELEAVKPNKAKQDEYLIPDDILDLF